MPDRQSRRWDDARFVDASRLSSNEIVGGGVLHRPGPSGREQYAANNPVFNIAGTCDD
jgi:hypothetical protein